MFPGKSGKYESTPLSSVQAYLPLKPQSWSSAPTPAEPLDTAPHAVKLRGKVYCKPLQTPFDGRQNKTKLVAWVLFVLSGVKEVLERNRTKRVGIFFVTFAAPLLKRCHVMQDS